MGRGKLCVFGGGDTPAEGLRVEQPPCDPPLCCSRRLPSAGALLHPWLQQPQPSSPKVLSKERIRQFLARRKWQVPGGMMGMWGWGWLWLKGSVPFLFPSENRESPAGSQEADPAVPEPGGEGIRGSG